MKETSERKRIAYEVMEGGLRGSPAARAFSWTLIILIILSITFMLIWDLEGAERWHKIFEVIETITVGIFTLELIFGCWTADIRFPDDAHPVLHYLREPMTIIQMLAILPFYMGVILNNTSLEEIVEFFELLKLLHLLKIGEIGVHAWKEEHEKKQKRMEEDSSMRPE